MNVSLGSAITDTLHTPLPTTDGVLNNSKGEPYTVNKAICMHEIDDGVLWKHMEYRTGHSESRRSRKLVLSSIATVVNYEYLFYWYLGQDGTIEYEIRLSGELSTNLLSEGENTPGWGTIVAPGVNSQVFPFSPHTQPISAASCTGRVGGSL